MYDVPDGSVPQSNTSTMPGWRIAFAARASLKKRFVSSGLSVRPGRRTLTAARRPIPGCSARYTTPIPPSPMSSVTL